jgi:ribonuclease HI
MDTLESLGDFDFELWTDGSVVNHIGVGAAVAFKLNDRNPFLTSVVPSGYFSSSYRSELVALKEGLSKFMESKLIIKGRSLLICTDSQSVISALKSGPILQNTIMASEIWAMLLILAKGGIKIVIQFVASHCGVPRNVLVDKLAANKFMDYHDLQHLAAIPFQAIKAMVKSGVHALWRSNLDTSRYRYSNFKGNFTDLKVSNTLPRCDEVLLAQLRTGECRKLGIFRRRINLNTKCRWCFQVDETVEHLYSECV